MFDPKLTIEVSATPELQGDDKYTVDREDVIIEEMIKKDIIINPDLDNIVSGVMKDGYKIKSSGEEESVDRLINMALAKKDKLVNSFFIIYMPKIRQMYSDINVPKAIPFNSKPNRMPKIKSNIIFKIFTNNTNLNTCQGLLHPNKIPIIIKLINLAGASNILISK